MAFFNFNDRAFEPKRKFRFLVSFSTIPDMTWMCKTANKPNYEMSAVTEHNVLNHTFKFPGKIKWQDMDITFIDAVEPNVGSRFYNLLRNSGYVEPTTNEALLTGITKNQTHSAIGEVIIKQLDGGRVIEALDPGVSLPSGVSNTNIVEEWTLKNAFIKGVQFGDLSYEDEGLVELTVGLTYDFASYSSTGRPYVGG